MFIKNQYEKKRENILSQMKYSLNIFQNVSTKRSSFEILYEIKPKNSLLNIIQKKFAKKIDFLKKKNALLN